MSAMGTERPVKLLGSTYARREGVLQYTKLNGIRTGSTAPNGHEAHQIPGWNDGSEVHTFLRELATPRPLSRFVGHTLHQVFDLAGEVFT